MLTTDLLVDFSFLFVAKHTINASKGQKMMQRITFEGKKTGRNSASVM
jgi:hypothetical protein